MTIKEKKLNCLRETEEDLKKALSEETNAENRRRIKNMIEEYDRKIALVESGCY